MGDNNNALIGLVILVIIILLIIWIVNRNNNSDSNGTKQKPQDQNAKFGSAVTGCARADPVGNVHAEQTGPAQVTITWDAPSNATSYKVFINACDPDDCARASNKTKVNANAIKTKCPQGNSNCSDSRCCPQEECDSCVSQSNYTEVVSTTDTSVVVQTCEACFCYLIVPYNACGEAGPCTQVRYAHLECTPPPPNVWLNRNDCDGVCIGWECSPCCEQVVIYVNCEKVATVPCCEGEWRGPQVPCGVELSVSCKNDSGESCAVPVIEGDSPCQNDCGQCNQVKIGNLTKNTKNFTKKTTPSRRG